MTPISRSKMQHISSKCNISGFLERQYASLGRIISTQPWPFISIPILITASVAYFVTLYDQPESFDAKALYVPYNAPGLIEEQEFLTYFKNDRLSTASFRACEVSALTTAIVTKKDKSDLLDLETLQFLERFNNRTIDSFAQNTEINYRRVCTKRGNSCSYSNAHINLIKLLVGSGKTETNFLKEVDIPRFMGLAVGGAGEDEGLSKAFFLIYCVKDDRSRLLWLKHIASLCEQTNVESEEYEVFCMNTEVLRTGRDNASQKLTDKVPLTVLLLTMFVTFSGARFVRYPGEKLIELFVWNVNTVGLMYLELFADGLATVSAIGLVLSTGWYFDLSVAAAPFLLMAIGVDDMFIMMAAWRRSNPDDSVVDRMAFTMRESAVSITFTSVTSAASFAVGCTSPILFIRIFCCYTAVGIVINYIYQITFFAGCMVIFGRVEKRRSFRRFWKDPSEDEMDEKLKTPSTCENGSTSDDIPTDKASQASDVSSVSEDSGINETKSTSEEKNGISAVTKWSSPKEKKASKTNPRGSVSFIQTYGEMILLTRPGRIVTLLIVIAYLSLSIAGLFRLEVGFEPKSLFLPTFSGARYFKLLSDHFWSKGWEMEVLVKNPGDLSDPKQRAALRQMQRDFDTTYCSMPMHGEQFWLEKFLNLVGDTNELDKMKTWSKGLYQWSDLNYVKYSFSQDLAWRDATASERRECDCEYMLRAYRFRIALQNYATSNQQVYCQDLMRSLAKSYKQYEVVTFSTQGYWTDQYRAIVPLALQNIAIATFCMVVISTIFLHELMCLLSIVSCILSIDLGVIGFMGWWNVRLDVISMVTILMSIGLSVDYSAHVTYAFKSSKEPTARARVLAALREVGLPVFQGAFTTFLGILPLSATGAYMGTSFFKVSCLVIVLGMLHGCVFLPVVFDTAGTCFELCCDKLKRCRRNRVVAPGSALNM